MSPLADRALLKSTVSFYRFQDDFDFSGLIDNGVRDSRAPLPLLVEVGFSRNVELEDRAFRQELILNPWRGHEFELGFEIHSLATAWAYDIDGVRSAVEPNAAGSPSIPTYYPGGSVPAELDSEVDGVRWGAWVQDRFLATPRIMLQPGLRIGRSGSIGRPGSLLGFARRSSLPRTHDCARPRDSTSRAQDTRSFFKRTTSWTSPTRRLGPSSTTRGRS